MTSEGVKLHDMSGNAERGNGSQDIPDQLLRASVPSRVMKYIKRHLDGENDDHHGSDADNDGLQRPTEDEKIENYRRGYPQLAAFTSSHSSFMMCRSFIHMRNHLLLLKQAELSQLEKELRRLENEEPIPRNLAAWEQYSSDGRRKELLKKMETKLSEYDAQRDAILSLKQYPSVKKRDYRSMQNYLRDQRDILPDERTFICNKQDLISIFRNEEHHTPVEHAVEFVVHRTFLRKYFKGKKYKNRTDNRFIHLYSDTRIKNVASIISTFVAVFVLVGPIIALKYIPDAYRVWCLIVFTTVFAFSILFITKAKRHELFAATAAFCAVLVVFIGRPGS
ncbi:hypothetical protein EDC01DRAFT_647185 [Geopyxis carbonaria]|nr:hypothetical protein EDC01DRAFT_647185 [Geopyxis carbonaria]